MPPTEKKGAAILNSRGAPQPKQGNGSGSSRIAEELIPFGDEADEATDEATLSEF